MVKCRPQSKSRNLEQTLALRMYTKGSDAPKMLLFRAFACKKRVPERGEEKDRKKIALGSIFDKIWLPFWLRFGSKMETKTRSKNRWKKRGEQKNRTGSSVVARRPRRVGRRQRRGALKLRFKLRGNFITPGLMAKAMGRRISKG